jgi:ABC-type bacteriocin/lantibiotic exporter with double-glycine peptidase domain
MINEKNKVIVSFDKVHFAYDEGKNVLLKDACFSIRENTKITIMGQNGA